MTGTIFFVGFVVVCLFAIAYRMAELDNRITELEKQLTTQP